MNTKRMACPRSALTGTCSRLEESTRRSQRGASLLVALILLAAIAFLSASAFNASTTNLRAVGNTVARQEALAAAQAVIDRIVSDTKFSTDPGSVANVGIDIDIDGDGVSNYQPRITPVPVCANVIPILVNELNPTDVDEKNCLVSGVSRTSGIESTASAGISGRSRCAYTEWVLRAITDDAHTGAFVAVNQGVGILVDETDADNFCK